MFRKLMAIETEALRQDAEARDAAAEVSERDLLGLARELSRYVPGSSRFGLCSARPVF